MYGGDERAHGLFEGTIQPGAVRVEDVDVIEAHALQAVVERGQHILARAADAVRPGPHIPAGLGRDQEFVAQAAEVLAQNLADVLLGRAIGRPVVVCEVEMRYAAIEGSPDDRAPGLEDICPAEVLPQTQRYRRQNDPRTAAAAKLRSVVTLRIWHITDFHWSPLARGAVGCNSDGMATMPAESMSQRGAEVERVARVRRCIPGAGRDRICAA